MTLRSLILHALAASLLLAAAAEAASVEEQAQICTACHGENGIPQDRNTPVIAGQKEGYLYLQLRDYKRGDRANDIMASIAGALERDEMLALAAYFSKQPWPNLQQPSAPADVTERSRRLNASIGCTGCHLDQYQGDGTQPRLAGQSREYLARSMVEFRSRTRANNPGMSDLMNASSPEDLEAIAQYLAGF